jgi:hypothetical protein
MEQRLIYFTIVLLIAAAALSGCKSPRQLSNGTAGAGSTRQLLEQAIAAQPDFRSLDIKRMTISTDKFNSPAICRILRDSAVYISAQPFLGIEMAAAKFTKSGFIVVDKMKKVAYTGDYAQLSDRLGLIVDYSVVEGVFTNQLFVLGQQSNSLRQLKAQQQEGVASLIYENQRIRQQFTLNPDFRIASSEVSTPGGQQRFTAGYSNFTSQDVLVFPYQYKLQVISGSRTLSASITITRMVANELTQIPELSVQGYRIGSLDSLIK